MAACGRCSRPLLADGQCPRCSELDRATAAEAEVRALREALKAMRAELWRQWEYNHAEHCGRDRGQQPPYHHDGDCHWPVPDVLAPEPPEGAHA